METHQQIPFLIDFGTPRWWWMPIHLQIDGKLFSFKMSNVLNDPMGELIAAARNIIQGGETASVVNMWREPEWNSLIFDPSANGDLVYISLLMNQDGAMEHPEATFDTVAKTIDVSQSIVSAFERMIASIGLEKYEQRSGWSTRFPQAEVAEAREVLNQAG